MSIYQHLLNGKKALVVVGLGYVGMPLAIEFAKKIKVIGFDRNVRKINSYLNGIDVTGEVGDEALKSSEIFFTCEENSLKDASFYIVAVPTPIAEDKTPDLTPLIGASTDIGKHLKKGDDTIMPAGLDGFQINRQVVRTVRSSNIEKGTAKEPLFTITIPTPFSIGIRVTTKAMTVENTF